MMVCKLYSIGKASNTSVLYWVPICKYALINYSSWMLKNLNLFITNMHMPAMELKVYNRIRKSFIFINYMHRNEYTIALQHKNGF